MQAGKVSYYQGGDHVLLLSPQGKKPTEDWKTIGLIKKHYDKPTKGYVFLCEGTTTTKMQLPKDSKRQLGLTQRFLLLQCSIDTVRAFSIELVVTDQNRTRRRVVISSAFRETLINPLHAQLPLSSCLKGQWCNLCLDMVHLVDTCFPGQTFRSIESLCLSGSCRLRRVFTMKDAPIVSHDDISTVDLPEYSIEANIPKTVAFPVSHEIQCKTIYFSVAGPKKKKRGATKTPSPKKGRERPSSGLKKSSMAAKPSLRQAKTPTDPRKVKEGRKTSRSTPRPTTAQETAKAKNMSSPPRKSVSRPKSPSPTRRSAVRENTRYKSPRLSRSPSPDSTGSSTRDQSLSPSPSPIRESPTRTRIRDTKKIVLLSSPPKAAKSDRFANSSSDALSSSAGSMRSSFGDRGISPSSRSPTRESLSRTKMSLLSPPKAKSDRLANSGSDALSSSPGSMRSSFGDQGISPSPRSPTRESLSRTKMSLLSPPKAKSDRFANSGISAQSPSPERGVSFPVRSGIRAPSPSPERVRSPARSGIKAPSPPKFLAIRSKIRGNVSPTYRRPNSARIHRDLQQANDERPRTAQKGITSGQSASREYSSTPRVWNDVDNESRDDVELESQEDEGKIQDEESEEENIGSDQDDEALSEHSPSKLNESSDQESGSETKSSNEIAENVPLDKSEQENDSDGSMQGSWDFDVLPEDAAAEKDGIQTENNTVQDKFEELPQVMEMLSNMELEHKQAELDNEGSESDGDMSFDFDIGAPDIPIAVKQEKDEDQDDDDEASFDFDVQVPETKVISEAVSNQEKDEPKPEESLNSESFLDIDDLTASFQMSSNNPDGALELMFDPILKCYYDPQTNKYYELQE